MFSAILSQFRTRADLLLAGDLDQVATCYHYPLPVHLADSLVVVRTPSEARAMLGHLRDQLIARGVVSVRPKIVAMDLPRAGRFRVWVDWTELAIPAEGTRVSSAVYYCRNTPSGLQVEMIDYTRLSMPELNPHFAALALSA